MTTRSSDTAEIARVGGHYTVQGHSRSLILVPIERPYAIPYINLNRISHRFARYRALLLCSNSLPNLSEIEQSAAELLRFECFTLWPWTCVTCSAMLCVNSHQSTCPFMKCNDFLMMTRYVTLWPWPLTPWPWTRVRDQVSCDQTTTKFEQNWSLRGCVIDDLANFLKGMYLQTLLLRGRWTELHQEQSFIIDAPTLKLW